ncbi:FecR domain-containing protein [Sphingobacterium sp. lm-10]|uniref:FecR family protein n=1 Tax=Sphingobacterium sp. lm-10 TaxID=2944904 RepID=UPI00201FD47C|nr:FecR domain-containing protein [Sphingobacterium sp. lm-10]MCL7987146.1 FecR domain-containing protein [Sphingobacterium sp. lm-10]
MKSKKRASPNREWTDRERQLREYLWNDPGIVERLFTDDAWKSYTDDLPHSAIPSEQMSARLQELMAADSRDKLCTLRRMRQRQQLARYAIAAAVLLFCGVFSWQVWFSSAPDNLTNNPIVAVAPLPDTSSTVLVNESKQPRHFTLPDGSTVKLYSQARLTYLSSFSPSSRELHLAGKAYFDVAKDAARPFTVYAGATKTTALGTSFTINTLEKNQRTSVTLHTGKVAVAPITMQAVMNRTILSTQGERILFDEAFHLIAHQTPNVQKQAKEVLDKSENTAVNHGMLTMDKIPLAQVMTQLGNVYGKTIHFGEPSLQQIQYTGTVDLAKEKLADVLAIICLINDLRYTVQEDGSYLLLRQAKPEEINSIHQIDTIKQ